MSKPKKAEKVILDVPYTDAELKVAALYAEESLPDNVHIITAQCRCGGYFNPNDEEDLIHAFKDNGDECGRRGWITGYYTTEAAQGK